MSNVLRVLQEKGLAVFASPYAPETLALWNAKLDPLFAARNDGGLRAYVLPAELIDLGIAGEYFNPAMRALIREVMPDAVTATFECYESRGGMRETGMYDANTEWHRDILALPGLRDVDPHFCSIFVYLTEVGEESGPFELRPAPPSKPLLPGDPSIRVMGPVGTSFIWNRAFYHRAVANGSNVRRRVLKISIQHNYLQNDALGQSQYRDALAKLDPGDTYLRFIFGERHATSHAGQILPEVEAHTQSSVATPINASARTGKLWTFYRKLRRKLWSMFS